MPYILHPSPYVPRPAPSALRPTPYILHIHPTSHALHPSACPQVLVSRPAGGPRFGAVNITVFATNLLFLAQFPQFAAPRWGGKG